MRGFLEAAGYFVLVVGGAVALVIILALLATP